MLPFLFLWLMGSFVFFDAFRSFSQSEKLAYTVTEIMSRHDAVDDTDIDYLRSLQLNMNVTRSANSWLRISSICYLDGQYKVLWSTTRADPGMSVQPLEDEVIPTDIMPLLVNHDTIILAEMGGRWSPLSKNVGAAPQDFVNRLAVRPRYVKAIPHVNLNLAILCPSNEVDTPVTAVAAAASTAGTLVARGQ